VPISAAHAALNASRIDFTQNAEARSVIVRTRMMLKCPGCDEPKLISVTIIDDIAGPALCDSCVTRVKLERRQAEVASVLRACTAE
jgi:hypothetical protein